jgi:hypothetical protein
MNQSNETFLHIRFCYYSLYISEKRCIGENNMPQLEIEIELLPPLQEIAERLRNGHASVMVGAGFSINTTPHAGTEQNFPSWNQLADIFYEKAHGDSSSHLKYLNVLKLAEEVEAAHNRPALDQLLLDNIPDKKRTPSKLHEKLLKLPWTDVFTTNYDTLLERACENVLSRKYDIVLTQQDLIFASKPRIIKLHGSFPSTRPFIITEEDYRSYPNKFAPFVNTVQQSLLENTLCLIGFSGDDPNFLSWIGWIRDNLKENAPKIYLVGIFDFTPAQLALLTKKNIHVVNMNLCKNINGSHSNGLGLFIDFLSKRALNNPPLDWPFSLVQPFRGDQDIKQQIEVASARWEQDRKEYPGWVIIPESQRKECLRSTFEWAYSFHHHKFTEIEPIKIFLFCHEYTWRIEQSLLPIFDDHAKFIEYVLEQTSLAQILNNEFEKSAPKQCITDLKKYYFNLQLSLLRYYREEGAHDKLEKIKEKISQNFEMLTLEQQEEFSYEEILTSLFNLDFSDAKKKLDQWDESPSLPAFEAKRASLHAEIGEPEIALAILENTLKKVRSSLNLQSSINISLLSLESWLILHTRYVESGLRYTTTKYTVPQKELAQFKNFTFMKWDNEKLTEPDSEPLFHFAPKDELPPEEAWEKLFSDKDHELSSANIEWNSLVDQWKSHKNTLENKRELIRQNELKQFSCDPWLEFDLLKLQTQSEKNFQHNGVPKPTFDIGTYSTQTHYKNYDEKLISGFNFVKMIEKTVGTARIYRTSLYKDTMVNSLKVISTSSPYWTLITLIRLAEDKAVDSVWDRKTLLTYNTSFISLAIQQTTCHLKEIFKQLSNADSALEDTYFRRLANVIPEILSHLCVKSNPSDRAKIIAILDEIFRADFKIQVAFSNLGKLTKRLITSCSDKELIDHFNTLILFPNLDTTHPLLSSELVDPVVYYFERINKMTVPREIISHKNETIKLLLSDLTSTVESTRKTACLKLFIFYEQDLLTPAQLTQFRNNLFAQHDEEEWPVHSGLYHSSLTSMCPCDLEPKLKKYILAEFQKSEAERAVLELLNSSENIKWSQDNFNSIIASALNLWKSNKNRLNTNDILLSNIDAKRCKILFQQLIQALARLICNAPHLTVNKTYHELINDMELHNITSLELLTVISDSSYNESQLTSKIEINLSSNDRGIFNDAVRAIKRCLLSKKVPNTLKHNLLNSLINVILWQKDQKIAFPLSMIEYLHAKISFTQDQINKIDHALNNISDYTALMKSHINFEDALIIRQSTASLAFSLSKNPNFEEMPSIHLWKEICFSEDEFAEIKNQWKE